MTAGFASRIQRRIALYRVTKCTTMQRVVVLTLCVVLLRSADVAAPRYGLLIGCGPTLTLKIAATAAERKRGIRSIEDFNGADGIAFVYTEPTVPSFWMQHTSLPLDIVFLSPSGRIVARHAMIPLTETRYTAPTPVRFVLEFPSRTPHTTLLQVGTDCLVLVPTRSTEEIHDDSK